MGDVVNKEMPLPKDPQKHQEYRDKMSQANKGKVLSQQTKLKLSQANKGKPTSEQTKLKMSLAHMGYVHSVEAKQKMSQSHKARWEGIETKSSLDGPHHRECFEHKEWKRKVFERDEYTCQDCGQIGGGLNAHHIFQWATHILFRFLVWNGKTLCLKCHKKIKVYRRVQVR